MNAGMADARAWPLRWESGSDSHPAPTQWLEHYAKEFARPLLSQRSVQVIWALEDDAIGFSSADKIALNEEAFMHLHIVDPSK